MAKATKKLAAFWKAVACGALLKRWRDTAIGRSISRLAGHGVGLLVSAVAVCAALNLIAVWLLAGRMERSSNLVQVMAYQQMLSEKMAYEAYMIVHGHEHDRLRLRETIESFGLLLDSAQNGGWALGLDLASIPRSIMPDLKRLRASWVRYRAKLLVIAQGQPGDPEVEEALRYIDIHSDDMLALDLYGYLETSVTEFNTGLRLVSSVGFALFATIIILLSVRVSKPLKALAAAARHLRSGGARAGIKESENGEAEQVALALNDMACELEESSSRLRHEQDYRNAILAAIPYGTLVTDIDLNIVWANEAVARDFFGSAKSLVGRNISTLLGTDEVRAQAFGALASGQAVRASYLGISMPGLVSKRILSVTASPLDCSTKPQTGRILLLMRDITSAKRIEQMVIEATRGFMNLIKRAGDGVIMANERGEITYANSAAESMFGWEHGELCGQPLAVLMPEKFRKGHEAGLKRFIGTGKATVMGSVLRLQGMHKGGGVFPLEMSLSVSKMGDQQSFVAMLRDITDRERVEDAVRQSEARFRSLSEHLPDAIVVHHEDQIAYLNPAALRLLGLRNETEVVGRPVLSVIQPSDREAWHEAIRAVSGKPKGVPPQELKLVNSDGATVDVELVVLPIDFDGKPAVASIFRDIRERKQLQAQLMHADRMASMGTLAAGIAHEINNPVGFVHSNLGALEKYLSRITELLEFYQGLGRKDGETSEAGLSDFLKEAAERRKKLKIDYILSDIPKLLGRSKEGTERIRKIVGDLKSFSRADEGTTEVDLNETIELALSIARNEIKYKAKVERKLGNVPRVKGDATALGQVFLNLVVNAAQAIKEQGTITVETGASNGAARAVISDTGSGIPPDNLKKIFDPFFTTKPPGKGTGLGLNIVYNIIRRHNGRIDVQSELNKGTTFTIELPVGGAE